MEDGRSVCQRGTQQGEAVREGLTVHTLHALPPLRVLGLVCRQRFLRRALVGRFGSYLLENLGAKKTLEKQT